MERESQGRQGGEEKVEEEKCVGGVKEKKRNYSVLKMSCFTIKSQPCFAPWIRLLRLLSVAGLTEVVASQAVVLPEHALDKVLLMHGCYC